MFLDKTLSPALFLSKRNVSPKYDARSSLRTESVNQCTAV